MRSNLSILNQLERKFNFQTESIMTVDFVGKYLGALLIFFKIF